MSRLSSASGKKKKKRQEGPVVVKWPRLQVGTSRLRITVNGQERTIGYSRSPSNVILRTL